MAEAFRPIREWEKRLVERLLRHAGKWDAYHSQLDAPVMGWDDGFGLSFHGPILRDGEAILAEACATTPAGVSVNAILFEGDGKALSTLDFMVNGELDVPLESLSWKV